MFRHNLLTLHHGRPSPVEDYRAVHCRLVGPLGHYSPAPTVDEECLPDDSVAIGSHGRPVLPLGDLARQLARHWHLPVSLRYRSIHRCLCDAPPFRRPVPDTRPHLFPRHTTHRQ